MTITIEIFADNGYENPANSVWNNYVDHHPDGSIYHYAQWQSVFRQSYGLKSFFLIAKDETESIKGILPLTQTNHFIFGNNLTALPFMDYAGVLADNTEIENKLLKKAQDIATDLQVDTVELRQAQPLKQLENNSTEKTRLIKILDKSAEDLLKSFKAKLRAQIKRPIKAGLICTRGGAELLDDFYQVFAVNMRDIGSPVHSKAFFKHLLQAFSSKCKIFIVYKEQSAVACSLIFYDEKLAENPWASSLRSASKESPNMLLYWSMLEFCCNRKIPAFCFGRSSPDSGTYRFKKQWGVENHPLYWYQLNDRAAEEESSSGAFMQLATKIWMKLPLPLANFAGPIIRKHIPL